MKPLRTCLWFDDRAEEAMRFYVSLFPNSSMGEVQRYVTDAPSGKKAGEAMVATATVNGQSFVGLNGGPIFQFTEAVSFQIECASQAEIDKYWEALTSNGGAPGRCGWCKDKFGVSWQVVPSRLLEILSSGDAAKAKRATECFMTMGKLDLAAIERAAAG
jgi:predicted 3-demethylubiquinone-9 3-methyltransferase (glyoxalase superfamily)